MIYPRCSHSIHRVLPLDGYRKKYNYKSVDGAKCIAQKNIRSTQQRNATRFLAMIFLYWIYTLFWSSHDRWVTLMAAMRWSELKTNNTLVISLVARVLCAKWWWHLMVMAHRKYTFRIIVCVFRGTKLRQKRTLCVLCLTRNYCVALNSCKKNAYFWCCFPLMGFL